MPWSGWVYGAGPPGGLDRAHGWSGNRSRPTRTDHDPEGMTMTHPQFQDPQPLVNTLNAIRDADGRLRPVLADAGPAVITAMLATATLTREITVLLLQEAAPPADAEEPGTGEALERATDLAVDARRHLVTALNLMVGAHAITANVADSR